MVPFTVILIVNIPIPFSCMPYVVGATPPTLLKLMKKYGCEYTHNAWAVILTEIQIL